MGGGGSSTIFPSPDSVEGGGGSGRIVSVNCTNRPVSAPAAKKSATNIGEITFGGHIFNVVSLNYLGKRHKKTFTKSWGGGAWPMWPPWLCGKAFDKQI